MRVYDPRANGQSGARSQRPYPVGRRWYRPFGDGKPAAGNPGQTGVARGLQLAPAPRIEAALGSAGMGGATSSGWLARALRNADNSRCSLRSALPAGATVSTSPVAHLFVDSPLHPLPDLALVPIIQAHVYSGQKSIHVHRSILSLADSGWYGLGYFSS